MDNCNFRLKSLELEYNRLLNEFLSIPLEQGPEKVKGANLSCYKSSISSLLDPLNKLNRSLKDIPDDTPDRAVLMDRIKYLSDVINVLCLDL